MVAATPQTIATKKPLFYIISILLFTTEIYELIMEAEFSETSDLSARKRAHGHFEKRCLGRKSAMTQQRCSGARPGVLLHRSAISFDQWKAVLGLCRRSAPVQFFKSVRP
ncbi:hypothetical protein SAMN05414139_10045 [Burkholderia sp. D7]|nr:hypothetical protein SAMN05414139_10045 [Burkholderia sp. D7]